MKKILCFLFFVTCSGYADQYSVIIESAKTNSSIHLFASDHANPLPNIQEIFHVKNNIGLSKFVDHPNDAPRSLKILLDDLLDVLKKKQIPANEVTINLFGTDGMRFLTKTKQSVIYESIKNYLKINYTFKVEKIQSLSGKSEGLYEWLAVNYLTGKFVNNQNPYGVLHVGDDSLQVVYASDIPINPFWPIIINQRQYKITTKNFSTLGVDQMTLKMNLQINFENCYQIHKFQMPICLKIFDELIQTKKLLDLPQIQWVSTARTAAVYHFFGVEDGSQDALESRMSAICALSWEQMKEEYVDSSLPEATLRNLCANGVYLDALLYRKMKLAWTQLWITNKTQDGHKINWTLGALLYKIIYLKK